MSGWVVHKFGGTSMAGAEPMRRVARIVRGDPSPRSAVVVSAMAGVTDALLETVERAAARDDAWCSRLEALRSRHLAVVDELLPPAARGPVAAAIEAELGEIGELLRALWLMRGRPTGVVDRVVGSGEPWAARILAAHLAADGEAADWLDARRVLVVGPGELGPVVDETVSRTRLERELAGSSARRLVVTGFIASDAAGLATTLGRNGSDHSASIFGALLGASAIHVWTDVDGVLSADPRRVTDARVVPELSYDEAMELAYFGAKVLHPRTMAPAVAAGIPISIRNTFRPEVPGTRIGPGAAADGPVRGLASIEGMALVNVEGSGMVGVPGIAERLFGALRQAGVSVVLISQGGSEHSICVAVPESQAETARQAVDRAFYAERHQGRIRAPEVVPGCAVLAAVGDGMAGASGVAGTFFGALGRTAVNVRAIAQGSSERNISVVIDARETTRALRAVHAAFWLSNQTLSIGLVGPGRVGSALLDQFAERFAALGSEFHLDLRVRGICGRERMALDERAIPLDDWRGRLEAGERADLDRFADWVKTDAVPHAVLIDCTADEATARRHAPWLARGIHVLTANKKGNAGPLADWRRIRDAARAQRTHYLYETTVGAGLPVIETLRDLIRTGDEVLRIDGVLSGTLSWLFHSFDGTRPFSSLVREAWERGYTEPDPRDDLAGTDVARKLVILAREIGLELEVDDLEVEGLVPAALESGGVEDFLDGLAREDDRMAALAREAAAAGDVLRYVGVVDPSGTSRVRLERYPAAHALAQLAPTDNVVQFRTRRYHDNPLVVRGPGAGPDVTAAGVFADLLRLASSLGAPL